MSLTLENVSRVVEGETWISDVNLTLEPGSFNVLLGRTLAGKTTLMRLMAGLDRPTKGKILMNGVDVTGVPVRERNISMVYQQFINYPNMTVFENIASPLRLANLSETEIDKRVHETAEMLRIEEYLGRLPLQLSGGQQQRTAMARALVKDSQVILFDEPLVNLDYKLREELRQELRALFKARNCIAVYATTEPNEALALSGNTAVLHEGRLLQFGETAEVYHQPQNIITAEMFSEPPINVVPGKVTETEVTFDDKVHFQLNNDLRSLPAGQYQFGVRASHIGLVPHNDDDLELPVQVDLAEISGSETFLHVHNPHFDLVLHLSGVHQYQVDQEIKVYFPTHKLYAFNDHGDMVHAPARIGGL
ncbi:ABC transporter ATP-binding protein [Marinomonas mediterranea]|jgi:carbohydrate ABC transporter ATP-binding protein, CUT1 family (TC 3.A.1.1.-)|uniref:Glycerol-3-phosphate-transporting ATPase n=1 Tax=Marinomonas mediterranea (strain ATCC 700492 / JCM 21426 / NBRC 103028 / MMB-1) TaxID=717774 RepID=F2JYQ0_MARM1|nr:ABC transporter ATP-binding protein [Marinomonas mediterranea]ADZ89675.1 Glycerol-3-phosphate-transporting ATPase [Marinomonas mediterranea MMB-1]WCN07767.1 ATP-binding cassette domain-containing protein [Marinomonas mediterranea]WCN11867.1 ATP-binding cassette domain-containing protein [Marinomonas mediterranea]WCN15912.1 ATP-binding cassette domain-containing protein [Marinomonas mediterranea MMB-1]